MRARIYPAMQPTYISTVVLILTIIITVKDISTVPSGKIARLSGKVNRRASLNVSFPNDRNKFDCVAVLPSSGCSGVLIAQRWLLTLSECTNTVSAHEVKFVCKGRAPFTIKVVGKVSRGRWSLLLLKRVALLSRMFHFELPQNPDIKQHKMDAFVSIIRKQTVDIIAESVLVDKCPLKNERIVNEEFCLMSKTTKRWLESCKLATGLPVATLNSNNAKTVVVALVLKANCSENRHRERREIEENPVIGRKLTESDTKWIRKVRAVDGKFFCFLVYIDAQDFTLPMFRGTYV